MTSELPTCSENLHQVSSVCNSWMWHLYMQMLWKSLILKMHLAPNMYKIVTLKGKYSGNHHFKMHLTQNMYQNKHFDRQMLKKIITCKMHVTPNMYKIITLKANAQKIVTCKMCLTQNMYKNCHFEGKC